MRNPRITCNNCTKRECHVFSRDEEGHLRRTKAAMRMIELEKAGLLTCFVPPKSKNWKFTDLISKVIIINPASQVLHLLANYEWRHQDG